MLLNVLHVEEKNAVRSVGIVAEDSMHTGSYINMPMCINLDMLATLLLSNRKRLIDRKKHRK